MYFNTAFKNIDIVMKKMCLVVLVMTLCVSVNLFAQQKKPFLVVLDAGHGGKDPGKIGHEGAKEKDVALSIVLKTGAILSKVPGVKVVYTRTTDVFVDLWERGRIANKADADLFVSVHCNAHNSAAIGSETWVLGVHANERNFNVAKAENEVILLEDDHTQKYNGFDPKSPTSLIGLSLEQEENLDASLKLASFVQNEFTRSLNKINRGVKQAGFVVLHQTYMPSVLIETGFLTHPTEGAYLNSEAGQNEMAHSISKSILKYHDEIVLNSSTEIVAKPVAVEPKGVGEKSIVKEPIISKIEKDTVAIKQPVIKPIEETKGSYTVLLATGKKDLSVAPYNFKGLLNVYKEKSGTLFKYFYGTYTLESEALAALATAKLKGYSSAVVVSATGKKTLEKTAKSIAEKPEAGVVKNINGLEFKVQIGTSTKNVDTAAYNFKGLENISMEKSGAVYKYFYGKTPDYQEALTNLKQAKAKQYSSAFIVATNNGKVIEMKEALKMMTSKK